MIKLKNELITIKKLNVDVSNFNNYDVNYYVYNSAFESVLLFVYDSVDRSLYNSLRKATLNAVYKQL